MLSKDNIEVYMFWLLLEWGRIADDWRSWGLFWIGWVTRMRIKDLEFECEVEMRWEEGCERRAKTGIHAWTLETAGGVF